MNNHADMDGEPMGFGAARWLVLALLAEFFVGLAIIAGAVFGGGL